MTLTRSKFESLMDHLIQRTLPPVKTCLKDAGVEPKDIGEAVLVGGMTRVPKVIEVVRQFFGREPFRGVNPDEAVAIGAAIQGGVLRGDVSGLLLLDVTPLSLGIETLRRSVHAHDPEEHDHPDEEVADVQHGGGQPDPGRHQGLPGAEREMAADNQLLGQFRDLVGIRRPRRAVFRRLK